MRDASDLRVRILAELDAEYPKTEAALIRIRDELDRIVVPDLPRFTPS